MKKMGMKTKTIIAVVMAVLMSAASIAVIMHIEHAEVIENEKGAAKKATGNAGKPGQVKNLKAVKVKICYDQKGKRNISSAQIKFSKVKGATGYQVLVYLTSTRGDLTPLVFEYTTKKTTYTVKNLVPDVRYTIKVKAYKKGKDGKLVYGKAKSLKIKTPGEKKGCYYTCNACHATMPGNLLAKHIRDAYKIHKEIHAGHTIYWK